MRIVEQEDGGQLGLAAMRTQRGRADLPDPIICSRCLRWISAMRPIFVLELDERVNNNPKLRDWRRGERHLTASRLAPSLQSIGRAEARPVSAQRPTPLLRHANLARSMACATAHPSHLSRCYALITRNKNSNYHNTGPRRLRSAAPSSVRTQAQPALRKHTIESRNKNRNTQSGECLMRFWWDPTTQPNRSAPA